MLIFTVEENKWNCASRTPEPVAWATMEIHATSSSPTESSLAGSAGGGLGGKREWVLYNVVSYDFYIVNIGPSYPQSPIWHFLLNCFPLQIQD